MKLRQILFLFWIFIGLWSCGSEGAEPIIPPSPEPVAPTVPADILETQNPQIQGVTYWWNEAVFYEIFVRSFYDSNGDGIGDLNGIREKLDYIQNDLGATALWLMPINPSSSYHGYDVTDYKAINPEYGTMQDFQNLVQELHRRGMKIIVDLVLNHTADKHPWFQSAWNSSVSEYRDWYIFENSKPDWGNWHGNTEHGYYYGAFSYLMPDLNYKNQALREEIKRISNYWLKEVDVDGFRLDAVKFLFEENGNTENVTETFAYWNEFGSNVKEAKSNALTVAEAWDGTATIARYVNTSLDLAFEFDLAGAILKSVKNGVPTVLKNKMTEIRNLYPYHQYATFLSNHDQDRSFEVMGKNIVNSKLAAAMLLTLPGTPFVYYGEEVAVWGMKGSDNDEWVRKPMNWNTSGGFTSGTPWSGLTGDQATKNVETQKEDDKSLLNWYKKLIALRKEYPQITKGSYQMMGNNGNRLYAFFRELDGKAVIVLANFGDSAYDNTQIYAKKTNLVAGIYSVTDLLTETQLDDVALNSDGGLLFRPYVSIGGKETKLLLLEKK